MGFRWLVFAFALCTPLLVESLAAGAPKNSGKASSTRDVAQGKPAATRPPLVYKDDVFSVSPAGVAKVGGIGVGSRVKRGPTWRYLDQDGGDGKIGTVVELKSWKGQNYTLGVRVRWDANGHVNTYRWSMNATTTFDNPGDPKQQHSQQAGAPFYRDLIVLGEIDLTSPLFAKAQEDADRANSKAADDAAARAAGRDGKGGSSKLASAIKAARRALLKLYRQCNGSRWFVRKGFQEAEEALAVAKVPFSNETFWEALDPCTSTKGWEGVTCNAEGIVFAVDLAGNNVDCGPAGLPYDAIIEGLPGLRSLNMERNKIAGPLSPLLCKLLGLQHLSLASNKLQGPLPECLAAMPKLETLALHSNELSGKIPKLYLKGSKVRTLKLLHLHGNADLEIDREHKQDARECTIPSLTLPAGQGVPRIKMRALKRPDKDDGSWPDGR